MCNCRMKEVITYEEKVCCKIERKGKNGKKKKRRKENGKKERIRTPSEKALGTYRRNGRSLTH